MSFPIVTLPMAEKWDCHQCGVCCRGSIVPLKPNDLERLEKQKWNEKPEYANVAITAPFEGGLRQLAKRSDGSCVFLQDNGLCRIHAEYGFDEKPLICRVFPMQLIQREKDAVLTVRRACPSAAADRGREVKEQLPAVRGWDAEGGLTETPHGTPRLKQDEAPSWKRANVALQALARIAGDERYPPIRRLAHGIEYCRLMEEAKTKGLGDGELGNLSRVIEENICEEAAPFFAERIAPSGGAGMLFRLTLLELARLHPRNYIQPTWLTRFHLAWWAMKMNFGRGQLPKVHPKFPVATFAGMEQPLGRIDPAIVAPLGRFFEASARSHTFALANRSGWSVLESWLELALMYPAALYLLRWATAGRSPEPGDIHEIITALDRAQGYAPLSGLQQRTRLRAMMVDNQLIRLLAWYGR
jgi:lysine-N-methylase